MSVSKDKFETLINFVSHIDDTNLQQEINSLANKIKRAENKIAVQGNTKELSEGLKALEAQVDSLYSRFEKFIPKMQEAQTLGLKFKDIKLGHIVQRFYDMDRGIAKAKSNLEETYAKLQQFVGNRGTIAAPDFNISGAENIQRWKQQLQELGATDVVFNGLTIASAKFEEALTGLGIKITTLHGEEQKLSAAGQALAQTFRNMGDSAFAAFDKMSDPQKLQALSDKIQNIKMTAWNGSQDDKTNREFLKMGIADGIQKEVAAADNALREFMTMFKRSGNVTIEEAKRIAKQLGGSLNVSGIVTNSAGEFHASAQLITKDLQTISFSLQSYKQQVNGQDIFGVATGGVSSLGNTIKQGLNEYQNGLNRVIQLKQQLAQAEQSGNQYTAKLLREQISLNEQNNASLKNTLSSITYNTEAMEGLVAVENAHRQTLAMQEANKRWEQEKAAIDGVIQKYNELKQAELKVQQASLTNAPKADRQVAMAAQVKAATEFQKAQQSLAPHLQRSQTLINGMADADARATAATLKLTNAANAQGFSLKTLGNQFKTLATNVLQYQLAWKAFQAITDSIKKVIQTTKELDTAMANIRIVTGQTQEEVRNLMASYSQLGKEVGATTLQVAEGAVGWLRQGRSLQDTTKLIATSAKLSKLGMMESAEATQLLTATINGFNIAAQDSETVVDKLVRLDLNFATSTQELATALQYTAASAKMANVSLDEILGMIAVVSATTRRSAESIGQSFKTMFSRLQRVSAGKDLDEFGESLNDVEKRLRSFGIEMRTAYGEWRDGSEIFSEVGQRWKELTSIEKSAIAEVLGGTRQRENLLVVFENWDKVLKATNISMNAAGTTQEKYGAYMDSLNGKVAQFTATWEGLVNNLNAGDTLKGFVDLGTKILEIVDKFHLLQVAMFTALGAGGFKLFTKGVVALDTALNGTSRTIELLTPQINGLSGYINMLHKDSHLVSLYITQNAAKLDKFALSLQGLAPAKQAEILNTMSLNQALKEEIANRLGLTVATNGNIVATDAQTMATARLSLAMKSLGANLKAVIGLLVGTPVGWIIMAVGAAVAAIAVFNKLTDTFEEHQEKIADLKQEYESLTGELDRLKGEIETTKDRIKELQDLAKNGEISLIEAEELNRLRLTNIELERELKVREAIAKQKKKDLGREILETYNPNIWDRYANTGNVFSQIGNLFSTGTVKSGDPTTDFRIQLKKLADERTKLKKLEEQLAKETIAGSDPARLKSLQSNIDAVQKRINNLSGATSDFVLTMQENIAMLDETDEGQKKLKESLQELINEYLRITAPQEYFSIKLTELSSKLGENGKKTKEYKKALNDLADDVLANQDVWEILQGSLDLTEAESNAVKVFQETGNKIEGINTAYTKVKNKIESQEIKTELNIDTSDLEDAQKEVSKLVTSIKDFKDASKDLKEAMDALNDGAGLTLDMVISLAEAYPELEEALALYLTGLSNETQILSLLQNKYNENTQAYKQSLIDKLSGNEQFYNKVITDNELLEKKLFSLYGIDVKQYRNTEQLKLDIAQKTKSAIAAVYGSLPGSLASAWQAMASGFGGASKGMLQTALATARGIAKAFGAATPATNIGTTSAIGLGITSAVTAATEVVKEKAKQAKALKEIDDAINDALSGIKIDAGGGSSSGGGGGGGSSSGTEEDTWKAEFDAAKAELDHRRKLELISTREYYDALNRLVEKYYKNNENYIDEYKSEEEALYDLKKELFEQDMKNIDTEIEVLESRVGQEEKILELYEKKMETAHLQADELRSLGVKDDTDAIRDLQAEYRSANQSKLDMLQKILDEQEEATEQTKNLLEIQGVLTAEQEFEAAKKLYQQTEETYQKFKKYYDSDERAFRSYIETKKNRIKDLRDTALACIDKMFDTLDNKMAKAEATLHYAGLNIISDIRAMYKVLEDVTKEGALTWEEFSEYRIKIIQKEREAVDNSYAKIRDASLKAIDAQIKALEEQKDADDEYYDEKINAIREIINAMDKEEDKESKLLNIEKKRLALIKAREQKTVQIYREGIGFVWESDPEAVKKATDDYNDAIREYNNWQKKLDLQGQIDDFEKAKNENSKIIDEQIKNLNKLREAWEKSMDLDDVFDEYEKSISDLMDDERLSFEERLRQVTRFTNAYLDEINRMSEANYDLEGLYNSINSNQNNNNNNNGNTGGSTDNQNGSGSWRQWTWFVEADGKAPDTAEIGDFILTNGGAYQITGGTKGKWQSTKINSDKYNIPSALFGQLVDTAPRLAEGTLSSPSTYSIVDELGEELIVRPPAQGRPTYLEKGTGVIPADITKNLWKVGQDPYKFIQEEFDKQALKYSGYSYNTANPSISIEIGDVNLSGVQDVDGLSKAIVAKLPNQIIRDLYVRK